MIRIQDLESLPTPRPVLGQLPLLHPRHICASIYLLLLPLVVHLVMPAVGEKMAALVKPL